MLVLPEFNNRQQFCFFFIFSFRFIPFGSYTIDNSCHTLRRARLAVEPGTYFRNAPPALSFPTLPIKTPSNQTLSPNSRLSGTGILLSEKSRRDLDEETQGLRRQACDALLARNIAVLNVTSTPYSFS